MRNIIIPTLCVCATSCVLTFVTGCETNDQGSAQPAAKTAPAAASAATAAAPAAAAPVAAAPKPAAAVIRIKAAATAPFTDSAGNVWQAEQGFEGGSTIERDAELGHCQHERSRTFPVGTLFDDSFSCAVPNGKYTAKLYFAETYDGISGAGERVFSFNVQGHAFKDFDVFAKAGGANRAYIETVPVEVTNGKFTITFTSNIENPEINAIELIPQM